MADISHLISDLKSRAFDRIAEGKKIRPTGSGRRFGGLIRFFADHAHGFCDHGDSDSTS